MCSFESIMNEILGPDIISIRSSIRDTMWFVQTIGGNYGLMVVVRLDATVISARLSHSDNQKLKDISSKYGWHKEFDLHDPNSLDTFKNYIHQCLEIQ